MNKNQTKLNIACLNVRGAMRSAMYLDTLLKQYDIDVLGISEHWLFPQSLHFLNSVCQGYESYGICCKDLDPLTDHHRGKGGLAFLFKTELKHVT